MILQVYDVMMHPDFVACNRSLLRHLGSGIFHCGVEVYGREWSYRRRLEQGTGVFSHAPRSPPGASHCESVVMGTTKLSAAAVSCLVEALASDWTGAEYNLLKRNCCHFCKEFITRLGITTAFPSWVMQFATCGQALIDEGQNAAAALSRLERCIAGHVGQAAEALDPCPSSLDTSPLQVPSKICPSCCVVQQEEQTLIQKFPPSVLLGASPDEPCTPRRTTRADSRSSRGGQSSLRSTPGGWAYREVLEF